MSPTSLRRQGQPVERAQAAATRRLNGITTRGAEHGTVAPATITDRTCRVVTGLDARPWRRALVELDVPHVRVGRRTVCSAAAWLAAIDRASGTPVRATTAPTRGEIIALAAGRRAR